MPLTDFQRAAIIAALFVAGVIILAALAISLLITPAARITTQFNLTTTEDRILITHTGGESLDCGHLSILLDDVEVAFPGEGSIDCPWSIGEILIIPFTPSDSARALRIVYDSGVGPQELLYAEIQGQIQEPGAPATPTVIHTTLPVIPTLTPTATPTPGIPVASFNATPRSGPVPLTVRFTDTSAGVPDEWLWAFGDGDTSPLQHPQHTYLRPGTYQVSLAVRNGFGSHTRINQGYITVNPAKEREIALHAGRGAALLPGGFMEFTVASPASVMRIGGQDLSLPAGSRVRLVVGGDGRGKISFRDGAILGLSFEQVLVYIDGKEASAGSVSGVTVRGYEGLVSNLDLAVEGGKGDIRILENGTPLPLDEGRNGLLLVSLRPDRSGLLNLDCHWPASTSFQGAVTGWQAR